MRNEYAKYKCTRKIMLCCICGIFYASGFPHVLYVFILPQELEILPKKSPLCVFFIYNGDFFRISSFCDFTNTCSLNYESRLQIILLYFRHSMFKSQAKRFPTIQFRPVNIYFPTRFFYLLDSFKHI